MRVLIADDEPVSRAVLSALLMRDGYQVIAKDNGDDALAALTCEDAPQLAVLDWMMPGTSGVEICQALRAAVRRRYTYIIVLTAREGRDDRLECIEAGADDYLSKPIDPAEMLARLRSGRRVILLENDLADRIGELNVALGQVKHLEGLITICMHCKRIAAGEDGWQKVEAYIQAHSNASFTHGLCQDCLDRHFPDDRSTGTDREGD